MDFVAERITLQSYVKQLKSIQPEIVGITATTSGVWYAHKVAEVTKDVDNKITTIIGGPHTSALPEQTLKEFGAFDIAVTGEGEYTMLNLLRNIRDTTDLKGIRGIAFRQDDEIYQATANEYISDLDNLPFPAWENYSLNRYTGFVGMRKTLELPIISGRGCPCSCIFCQQALGRRLRERSVESVIEEIMYDLRFEVKSLFFCDETFTMNKPKAMEICEKILKKGLNRKFSWSCETRVDCVGHELMKMMKDAGCRIIHLGVESGNEEIRKIAKKGITYSQIRNAFDICKKVGMKTTMDLIFGLPYETKATLQDSLRLISSVNPDYVSIGILVPFPGTKVYEMAKQGIGGLRIISHDWRDYERQMGDALELERLSQKDLKRYQLKGHLKVFLKPSRIMNLFEFIGFSGLMHMLKSRLSSFLSSGQKEYYKGYPDL